MALRLIRLPVICTVLLTCLLSTTLIGGCPAAQEPTVPPQEDEQATQQPPTTPDDGLDRPISQPDLDDTTTSDPGGDVPTGSDDQAGPGGDGDGEADLVIISVEEPSDPLGVRPGTVVNVRFNLLDLAGAVDHGELLLARDDDSDGQPDDAPVLSRSIPISEGVNTVAFNSSEAVGFLTNGFGRFLLGVRLTTISNEVKTEYSPATVTIDAVEPTAAWVGAGSPPEIPLDQEDHLVNRDMDWEIQLTTSDNSPHTVRIWLEDVEDGTQFELVAETTFAAGTATRTFSTSLSAYPAGTYYYYVRVSDGIDPPLTFHAENPSTAGLARLAVTNRLIGTFELEQLTDEPSNPAHSKGAILQGFNFNDLAGSSMVSVPDLDGDGDSELVVGARFGKPNLSTFQGSGWGEAYLIYGDGSMRLKGLRALNSVGADIPGLTFRGIRVRQNNTHTEGLADITVVEDMDGDELPELVFSFPRVESLSLKSPAIDGQFQHPDLVLDIAGMGNLEYDAVAMTMGGPVWVDNVAQLTRGGIVIVSSHNELLTNPARVTRKFDRVLDLHEVGQMFSWMTRASVAPYILSIDPNDPFLNCADCISDEIGCDVNGDPNDVKETEFESWIVTWDVWLGGG